MSRATMNTVRAFARRNAASLLIRPRASFDSMTDCLSFDQVSGQKWTPVQQVNFAQSYDWGIPGAWFVRSGRNYIQPINEAGVQGFEISNSCAVFALAVRVAEEKNAT